MVRIVAVLLMIGVCLTAEQAAAQFGGLFGNSPPRPPADVPGGGFPAQPPPGQTPPPYAAPTYPAQPSYPPQSPYASQSPYGGQQPNYGAQPPSGIQSQPLPPPRGATAAPPTPVVSTPPAPAPGTKTAPQQANTSPPPNGASPPPADTPPPDDTIITEMPAQKITNGRAVFSGLDKITGRTISFDAAVGETVQFGALRVTPRVCYTRPPTEATNTDAFIEVDEVTLKGEIRRIFNGWMFAASPGLHAVEHPIYDVWLTDCADPQSSPVAQSGPPSAAASTAAAATPSRQRQTAPRQQPPPPAAPFAAPVTDD